MSDVSKSGGEVLGEVVTESTVSMTVTLCWEQNAWEDRVIQRDGCCWRCKGRKDLMARMVGPKILGQPFVLELSETICAACLGVRRADAPKTVRLNVAVDVEQYEQLSRLVAGRNQTLSDWVRGQIELALRAEEGSDDD